MKKKILTLDDLYQFCKEQKLYSFSAQESGNKLYVHAPAEFEIDEETKDENTLYANIQIFHTGRNRNASNVTEDAAKEAIKRLAYKPILANFCEDENGVRDFTSHDMEIDDEGNIVYLERQVGCFTADEAYMRPDEKVAGRINVFGKVAIPREYTDAAEIIERKNGTKVSVELAVNEMKYDVENDELLLTEVEIMGCTCLGINPVTGEEVMEGMEGAHIQLEDFSAEKNSIKYEVDVEYVEVIKGLITQAVNEIKNAGKEDEDMTLENDTKQFDEAEVLEQNDEAVEEESEAEVVDAETEAEDNTEEAESEVEPTVEQCAMEYSITADGITHNFKRNTEDEIRALEYLVNATYSEADNDYYRVYVYADDQTVVMCGWMGTDYRQNYSVDNNEYVLVGEREIVTPVYMTAEEEAKYNEMISGYDSLVDELNKYHEEPEKAELINSDEYALIKDTEEYQELSKKETYFNMSKDEISNKLNEMLLAYAKKADFSAKTIDVKPNNNRISVGTQKLTKKNYGSLLDF
jgi:hypothetical protein